MTEEIIIERGCNYCNENDKDTCYLVQLQRLEQENKKLLEARNHFMGVNLKYFNVLEEIKNVLKEICKEECDYTKPRFCGDCDCRYGQILDKIDKVLKYIY